MDCDYGRGFSVLEVIDIVNRVSGDDFKVDLVPPPRRRSSADRRTPR
jgi:UDP-glucose 4-epimerase